jgi:hypothetical protein
MSAVFSPCRTWRYTLTRWTVQEQHEFRSVLFVCLNPSTADESKNDPTVRRCLGFAQRWGFDRMVVCNIFAFRSTDPAALYHHDDPIGPENDAHLAHEAQQHELVIGAWGNHGEYLGRGDQVMQLLREYAPDGVVNQFGVNARGQPKHPLYLHGDTQPELAA